MSKAGGEPAADGDKKYVVSFISIPASKLIIDERKDLLEVS